MITLFKTPLYLSFAFLIACGGSESSDVTESSLTAFGGKKTEHPNNKETGPNKSKGGKPVVEEPVVEEPVVEEPVVEEPVVEEPVIEEPVVEEPVVEEPVVEEPVVEEPVVEEPVVEEPVDDAIAQALTLRWNPTYQDDMGNTVHKSEIETYTLYWGHEENNLTEVIQVNNMGADSYVFTAQTVGDYYFAISVESIYGTHSDISNVVYKQVN
jgi:hypothetical protein